MQNRPRYTWSALIISACLTSAALAENKNNTPASAPNMEELMKKAEAAEAPGEAHKALEPLVGNWSAEVKCWMAPDAPPMVSKGTAQARWVMNGRFVQEEFSGEFMGKPFQGIGLTGFDNSKKKYTSVWLDDMHTSIFSSLGTGEKGSKVISLEGKMDCPMTGEKDVVMKQVLRIVSRDQHVLEMHDPRLGDKSKTMEITYTRK